MRRAPHAREIDSLREALGAEVFSDAWEQDDPAATLQSAITLSASARPA